MLSYRRIASTITGLARWQLLRRLPLVASISSFVAGGSVLRGGHLSSSLSCGHFSALADAGVGRTNIFVALLDRSQTATSSLAGWAKTHRLSTGVARPYGWQTRVPSQSPTGLPRVILRSWQPIRDLTKVSGDTDRTDKRETFLVVDS